MICLQVGVQRISSFLALPEVQGRDGDIEPISTDWSTPFIEYNTGRPARGDETTIEAAVHRRPLPLGSGKVVDGTFIWGVHTAGLRGDAVLSPLAREDAPTLVSVNVAIPANSLVCVYGPTGCGQCRHQNKIARERSRCPGDVRQVVVARRLAGRYSMPQWLGMHRRAGVVRAAKGMGAQRYDSNSVALPSRNVPLSVVCSP
jgi:hypothetical protein